MNIPIHLVVCLVSPGLRIRINNSVPDVKWFVSLSEDSTPVTRLMPNGNCIYHLL